MLAKLKISYRLFVLLGATTFAMLVTGIIGAYALNFANTSARQLQEAVTTTNQMANLTTGLQENFVNQLANLRSGSNTWVQTDENIRKYSTQFQQQFSAVSSLSQVRSISMATEFENNAAAVNVALSEFLNMNETQSRAHLELFILNDLDAYVTPFLDSAQKITNQLSNEAQLAFIKTENTLVGSQITGSVIILISLGATVTLGLLIAKSINSPINTISQTVQAVKENKQDVRTQLTGLDEINQLGQALDALLDEKQVTFEKMEEENNNINDSIIELLEGTSQLSERDLTVSLTVREDITGPVADALNMVTEETGQALAKISQVSHLVDASGSMVNEQTRKVAQIAARERKLVNLSKSKLETMSTAMEQIANWCKQGDEIAETASLATNNATEAVGETVDSMNEIRDIISQAEKRIKRLSERSQEITAIIDIINNIAERTHVLALNASMQAASAGEAGKGFAVVADEVQRLAESSRNSTSQIGVLVRNIQTETSEAVETMNASISKVVDGSEKARLAGEQMQNTKNATNKLVGAVNQISQSAEKQREQTSELRDQSNNIEKSTRVSELELRRQAEHIKRLMTAAKILNDTVNLFKVPEELLEQKLVSTENSETAQVVPVTNNVVNH